MSKLSNEVYLKKVVFMFQAELIKEIDKKISKNLTLIWIFEEYFLD